MRSRVVLCLCLFVAGQAQAVPTANTAANPATWPGHGPYRKVGNADHGMGIIEMPVPVVAAVQRFFVPDNPSRGSLFDGLHDFAGHGWPILRLYGHTSGYLTLLQARGAWTILSAPASLPVLNEVLDPLTPADLRNRDKLETYLWHVVLLQRHGQGDFVDEQFRRERLDNPYQEWWHQGTETRRRTLRALCHDPVVTSAGEHATAAMNFLTMDGAVEIWTFHLRLGQRVQLEGTEVRTVHHKGTFFHPV